jgi:hypothetical protein
MRVWTVECGERQMHVFKQETNKMKEVRRDETRGEDV